MTSFCREGVTQRPDVKLKWWTVEINHPIAYSNSLTRNRERRSRRNSEVGRRKIRRQKRGWKDEEQSTD
jgi:hypothetical protein